MYDPPRKGLDDAPVIEGSKSKFRGLDEALARQRLNELNAAPSLRALPPLRCVGLHKLKGDRAGCWAIRVDGPWRIVFRFEDGNAHGVEIVDYD